METTVLILAHNEARPSPHHKSLTCVEAAIMSVIGQDNTRILFVDDGSTDDTLKLAKQALRDSGLKYDVLHNEINLGVALSAQIAFSIISNKNSFLLRLDADDILMPDAISILKKAYEEGTFVSGSYREFSPDLHDSRGAIMKPGSIFDFLACGVLMHIKDIVKAGGFAREDVGVFIEYDLYLRLISYNVRPVIIDNIVYEYYRHSGSITDKKDLIEDSLEKLSNVWDAKTIGKIRAY